MVPGGLGWAVKDAGAGRARARLEVEAAVGRGRGAIERRTPGRGVKGMSRSLDLGRGRSVGLVQAADAVAIEAGDVQAGARHGGSHVRVERSGDRSVAYYYYYYAGNSR